MAVFSNAVLTTAGLALYTKAQSGTQLNFTRLQVGSGQLSGQDPTQLTALISPIEYFSINSISSGGNTAHIKGIFENTNITESTYLCEIGLFATDPSVGEILFAYANATDQGDTIPPVAAGPFSEQYQVNIAIGNASSVTATIPANTYVPTTDKGVANGVATLGPDGKLPTAQIPDATNLGAISAGSGNASVSTYTALMLSLDTRTTTFSRDTKGRITGYTMIDPNTNAVIETVTLNFNADGTLNYASETAGGHTATETMVYTGGALSDIKRTVS